MVTLATLANLNDAYLLRSMLEASDIPAFIPDENTCQTDWGYINAIGGVRVQIPEEFAGDAAAVLKDFQDRPAGQPPATTEQNPEFSAAKAADAAPLSSTPAAAVPPHDAGWWPLVLIFLCLTFFAATALYEHRDAKDPDALTAGDDAFSRKDFDLAIKEYSAALESDPKNARTYVLRGMAYDNAGKYDNAIADYSRAIALDPNDEYAWVNRGKAYADKGDRQHSIADSTQAIQLDPKDTQAYFNRGDAYLALNKYDQAIADFGKAIETDAWDANAYFNRAGAYDNTGDFAKAIADYTTLIKMDPDYENGYIGLAWDLATTPQANLRDGNKAVEYANKACELSNWKDSFALDTLAAAYAESGDFSSAVKWEHAALDAGKPDEKMIAKAKERLNLYEKQQPFRSGK